MIQVQSISRITTEIFILRVWLNITDTVTNEISVGVRARVRVKIVLGSRDRGFRATVTVRVKDGA